MPAVSIARFTDELMSLYAHPARARSTRRQVVQVLREFAAVPGVKKTSDLRAVTIARWIEMHPNRTAVTTRSHLRCLRALMEYAEAEGYVKRNPFAWRKVGDWVRSDSGPTPRPRPKAKTVDDVTCVLELADREAAGGAWDRLRLRALVYVYAYLGLRAAEALHLWVGDVDLARSVVSLRQHPEDGWKPKTLKSSAMLPVAQPLAAVLTGWIPQIGCRWLFPGKRLRGPWLHGGPGVRPLDQVKELGERAGVAGLTIHSFRKTIGTYAKRWGFSQLELKALLRHSNVETQRWYDDEAVDSLRPAVDKVAFPRIVSFA